MKRVVSEVETLAAEQLAYWFFRLNGCLTIVNFILHSEDRYSPSQRTDADILAVRFPYREELLMSGYSMQDHPMFDGEEKRTDLIIAEVKTGICRLNGPWTNPKRKNINRVLFAMGAFHKDGVDDVALSLYERGFYQDDNYRLRMVAIGKAKNAELEGKALQLTWQEVTRFIFERFNKYARFKAQHEQWDDCGRTLYDHAVSLCDDYEDFQSEIFKMFGIAGIQS